MSLVRSARRLAAALALTLWGAPTVLEAQGVLSAQGFGYPPGGLSARALGTAGATAEFDLLSMRNPAAISDLTGAIASVQGEPELRTVRIGDVTERSRLQRVPLVAAGLRVRKVSLLVSGSTLLDRTFATRSTGTATIDGRTVSTTDDLESRGALTELRLGAGWSWKTVRLGAAAIAVTGDFGVVRGRSFPEELGLGAVRDSGNIGFQGVGASFGVNWRPLSDVLVGASWRVGGALDAVRRDTAVRSATVPGRLGIGLLFDGIDGVILAASGERVQWASMNGLGSEDATARNATNWSVGAEVASGAIRRFPIFWRVGYGQRELPFLVRNEPVSERAVHGGVGLPLAGEGAVVDFAVQRSQRRLVSNRAQEDAWSLTAGLTIRP